jgi:hypothetical protein
MQSVPQHTSPLGMLGSTTAPNMRLALLSTRSYTCSAASLTCSQHFSRLDTQACQQNNDPDWQPGGWKEICAHLIDASHAQPGKLLGQLHDAQQPHLEQSEVRRPCDVPHNARRALDSHVQQGAGDRLQRTDTCCDACMLPHAAACCDLGCMTEAWLALASWLPSGRRGTDARSSMQEPGLTCSAASRARPLPLAHPCPISDVPALLMMVRTSAKSTFTSPGICGSGRPDASVSRVAALTRTIFILHCSRDHNNDRGRAAHFRPQAAVRWCAAARDQAGQSFGVWPTVMMSDMPRTPCRSTSSATLKASITGTFASTAAAGKNFGVSMLFSVSHERLSHTCSRLVPLAMHRRVAIDVWPQACSSVLQRAHR